jgi:putative membrane protein
MKSPIIGLVVTVAATALSLAYADDSPSSADRAFVAMVSQGGMFEVKAGQVAADKGSTQDIKDQGFTEAHDHQLVGDKLKSITSANGLDFPQSLNPQFQRELDDLNALSGPTFDATYLKDMKDIHAKDGAAFAKEATTGNNPALKSFASETHRIVLRHIGELSATGPNQPADGAKP